jgi:hypothetical protein
LFIPFTPDPIGEKEELVFSDLELVAPWVERVWSSYEDLSWVYQCAQEYFRLTNFEKSNEIILGPVMKFIMQKKG